MIDPTELDHRAMNINILDIMSSEYTKKDIERKISTKALYLVFFIKLYTLKPSLYSYKKND